jgi:hypothetical protein
MPPPETKPERPLPLLSVVIPARDEEGCIASTIEHLHLEQSLDHCPRAAHSCDLPIRTMELGIVH